MINGAGPNFDVWSMWATALYSELADARRSKFSFAEFGCDVLRVGRIRDQIKKKEKKREEESPFRNPRLFYFFFQEGVSIYEDKFSTSGARFLLRTGRRGTQDVSLARWMQDLSVRTD